MFTMSKKECFSSVNYVPERISEMKSLRTSRPVARQRLVILVCTLLVAAFSAGSATAQDEGAKATVVFDQVLPNVPGKSMKGILVEYGPGVVSPGHIHPQCDAIRKCQVVSNSELDSDPLGAVGCTLGYCFVLATLFCHGQI